MAYVLPTDWELKDFYRANVDSLFRCCHFLTCGECDSEAMVKDIFLKLLNKGMIFSSDKDGKAWMILNAYKLSIKTKKYAINPAAASIPDMAEEEPASSVDDSELTENESPETDELVSEGQVNSDEETHREETESAEEDSVPPADVPEIAGDHKAIEPVKFPDELRKLSRRDRLIALMYYCEGFRKSEIASYLGCTTFMINSRLKNIKKRILQEKGGDE